MATHDRFTQKEISKDDLVERVLALLLRSGRVPTLAAADEPVGTERLVAEEADECDPLRTPSKVAEERVINSDGSRLPSLLQGLDNKRKDLRRAAVIQRGCGQRRGLMRAGTSVRTTGPRARLRGMHEG